MYYLVAFIVSVIIIFSIYNFYPNISSFIKNNFMPSQNMILIKKKMRDLDSSLNREIPREKKPSQITNIISEINEIFYLSADFLYKLIITYVTPIFYNIYQPFAKNI
jgi:hypothetical protein